MLTTLAIGAALLGATDTGHVVFARERDDVHTVQRLDLSTGELTQLAKARGGIYDVTASPDGSKIAYLEQRRSSFEIHVLSGGRDALVHRLRGPYVWGIDWDPAGERIVFAAGREGRPRTFDLWTAHAGGGGVRRVTRNGLAEIQPTYTEDGRRIVFVTTRRGTTTDLASVRRDGDGRRLLTRTKAFEYEPEAGPGGRIAYADFAANRLLVRGPGGGTRTIARTHSYSRVDPSWSPDGRTLVFSLRWQVAAADLLTGKVKRLLRSGADDRHAVLVP